ncbi:glycosyltransferase [Lacinutrix sp. C3R15]|uniref:glycosyltransferase n=1 Tax=Flavobacteriaceae TaxID=49546 RepID=UPI001C0825E3|nr:MULTISPECIES: glycosyltransferase [Flavobacteriaceae]MBU2939656.1 glycosyltransferase [Lacinutrix sp. C3R15]MDO6622971.1 glycosyltransferase [Oceanihabitans sp. 1_MG-2023]
MQNNNKKKICVVTSSLDKGGAEKSSATLTNILYDLGYEVHVVTILPEVEYQYSGTLYNLGELTSKSNSFLVKLQKFKNLKKYLKAHDFECVIDNRYRVLAYREFVFSKYLYNSIPVIYVLHNYVQEKTFTPYKWLNIFLYKNETFTAVSKEISQRFKKEFQIKKMHTIYNAFDFKEIKNKALATSGFENEFEKYIIFYGRIDDQHKNLTLLLNSYKESELPKQNIKLLILGNGEDYATIVQYTKTLGLEQDVIFKGFTTNPYPYVKKAMFTMLTSRHEGFPMVIPESLALATPVISVDCTSGPKEVIVNNENGLLVKNYDTKALAKAMNSFIFDKALYLRCKGNAQKSVEKFSVENISKDWKKLIESLNEN